jgi:hypothetical protein
VTTEVGGGHGICTLKLRHWSTLTRTRNLHIPICRRNALSISALPRLRVTRTCRHKPGSVIVVQCQLPNCATTSASLKALHLHMSASHASALAELGAEQLRARQTINMLQPTLERCNSYCTGSYTQYQVVYKLI